MKKVAIRQLVPATALLFALGVTLASAQDAPSGHRKMGGFGILRGLSRLDLTESQKNDVRRIMDSRKATFESLHERARVDREALHSVSEVSAPDTSAVRRSVPEAPVGPGSSARGTGEHDERNPLPSHERAEGKARHDERGAPGALPGADGNAGLARTLEPDRLAGKARVLGSPWPFFCFRACG